MMLFEYIYKWANLARLREETGKVFISWIFEMFNKYGANITPDFMEQLCRNRVRDELEQKTSDKNAYFKNFIHHDFIESCKKGLKIMYKIGDSKGNNKINELKYKISLFWLFMYSAVVQEFRENNKLKTARHKEIENDVEVNKKDTFKYSIKSIKKELQSFLNTLV